MQSALVAAIAVVATPFAFTSDDLSWKQWRGAQRDAQFARSPLPDDPDWRPVQVWSVGVGEGHSSPVADDKGETVFVLTRLDERERVSAFDVESGEELWQDDYEAEIGINPAARFHGKWPRATPVFADGKLFTFGASAVLTCYDPATGRVLWRYDEIETVDTTKDFCGSSMSPYHDGQTIYVHVGDDRGGQLLAFDAATGEVNARWEGEGPGYASPIAVEIDGVRQLVTLTDRRVVSFALPDLELLWSLPFEDKWIENIITPLVHDDVIIYSGIRRGTFAVKPSKTAAGWTTESLWSNRKAPLYMSSPVLIGDTLVGLSPDKRGSLIGLDLADGKQRWTGPDGLGEIAAVMAAGGQALVLTQAAELLVGSVATDQMTVDRRYELGEGPIWTHPLFIEGGVVTKNANYLTRWKYETGEE